MVQVLILDKGSVQYRSVSSAPLTSHWRASPEMRRGVTGLSEEPPGI